MLIPNQLIVQNDLLNVKNRLMDLTIVIGFQLMTNIVGTNMTQNFK